MASNKARSRFKNAVYRVVNSDKQLERRLKLIDAFININLREELYLATGVEKEKDKPMWKVIETDMLLQEHIVNLEEKRLLWKHWNRGNQTDGKACSKNPIPHVCICDQHIKPKGKVKNKGKGKRRPVIDKKEEDKEDDGFCGCCCKSRSRTATPVPIADVNHEDTPSETPTSLSGSASNSNANSFVNSKSNIKSKTGSVGRKNGKRSLKNGSGVSSSTGSENSRSSQKSMQSLQDGNSGADGKPNTKVGLNITGTHFPKSTKGGKANKTKSAENEEEKENKSDNSLLNVPEYHTSAISLAGPHTAASNESGSLDAPREVIMVDAETNTILCYIEPKSPKLDIYARIKKKPVVEKTSPKPTTRKTIVLKPGDTLKIYKLANQDIQKKLARQKAAVEEAEEAIKGFSQNDQEDPKWEETQIEEKPESERKTEDDALIDVETISVPDQESVTDREGVTDRGSVTDRRSVTDLESVTDQRSVSDQESVTGDVSPDMKSGKVKDSSTCLIM